MIHHVNNLAVHSLARQLLDHETVGAVASSTAAGAVAGAAPLQCLAPQSFRAENETFRLPLSVLFLLALS